MRISDWSSDVCSSDLNREDVPMSSALELILREALTGARAAQGTETGLSLVREWISNEAGGDLTALSLLLDDQVAFAETAKLALRHADLIQSDEPLAEGAEDRGEQTAPEAQDREAAQEN